MYCITVVIDITKLYNIFPKGISPTMNVIERMEFELDYKDVTMKHNPKEVPWKLFLPE